MLMVASYAHRAASSPLCLLDHMAENVTQTWIE
jgi:hypothetical protein